MDKHFDIKKKYKLHKMRIQSVNKNNCLFKIMFYKI